jgi:hypothetical protein
MAIRRWFIEGSPWIVVPVAYGYLAWRSVFLHQAITVMEFCVVSAALSPWLLSLATRYLSEFNIGPKGVSGKTREMVRDSAEIDRSQPQDLANIRPPAASEFGKLIVEAKKVLRTLWKFQTEHFGANYDKRWGFGVGPGAPDYSSFLLGVSDLVKRHFVYVDSRGFVFLTNLGIEFCQEHTEEINNYPDYYSRFTN